MRLDASWRMLCTRAAAVLPMLFVLSSPTLGGAQTTTVIEFLPSAEHAQSASGGQPMVSRYELLVYQAGAQPYLRIDLGKPSPQADGLIRVGVGGPGMVWPVVNTPSEGRVVAHGPGGMAVSVASNVFSYECAVSLSAASATFPAAGGTGAVTVTAPAQCGRGALSSAEWAAITSGATGGGPGTVAYTVGANSQAGTRVATLTIGGRAHTITQAGVSGDARYLGDMPWAAMTNGWGPAERNRSNGEQGANDGVTMRLAGQPYSRGLGVHASSDIRYALDGACTTFDAAIGVDDEVGDTGSVAFQVRGDGRLLFDSGLMTGATATRVVSTSIAGVRELALIVTDGGDGANHDHADWADARVVCTSAPAAPAPSTRYLSDLPWSSATNGWGPVERDRSNGEAQAGDGRVLTLNGRTYQKGLGAHAESSIRYAISGCTRFQASVGVDDEVGALGAVRFQVLGDGTSLFDSGRMAGATATREIDVSLAGRRELALVITADGGSKDQGHGDWAEARITCIP